MGMANSAQAFQRLAYSVVSGIPSLFCYLDDLIIYSKSQKEQLQTLKKLFTRLSEAGLSIALSQCTFGADSVEYLGYRVSSSGLLAPLPKKVEALTKFPAPTKQKDSGLAYLGVLNYYRASLPKLEPEDSCSAPSSSLATKPAKISRR